MYSKLGQVSVLGIMSERQDFLPKKDQDKEIEPDIQIRPASQDPKGCPNIAPSRRHLSHIQELQGGGGGGDGGGDDEGGGKDQKKMIEPGISTRPTPPEGYPDVPPPSSHLPELRGFRELRGQEGDKEQQRKVVSGKPTLGESEVAEDDDGFRTPDSLEHRIPVITECPPAPKKTRPKISSAKRSRTTAELLDLSDEVESLFPPAHTKIKKFKREEDDDGAEL